MNYVLNDTTIETETTETSNDNAIEMDIATLQSDVAEISTQVTSITEELDREVESNSTAHTSLNAALTNVLSALQTLQATVNELSSKTAVTATTASISEATINKLNVTGASSFTQPITADIDNANVKTDDLTADDATIKNATVTNATIANATITNLNKVGSIESDSVTADTADIDAINSESIVTKAISLGGIDMNNYELSFTGLSSAYLHKLVIDADGLVVIKMNDCAITIAPGSVSSNCPYLYAAYQADSKSELYFTQDWAGEAVVIGEAEIVASMVLKSSVRKNVDSNGQPNSTNEVKVAVVSALPTIGQRNVIYVVLGDCAYYCDGQYFYEMASKKRG